MNVWLYVKKYYKKIPKTLLHYLELAFTLFHKEEYEKSYGYAKKSLITVKEKEIDVLLRLVGLYSLISLNKFDEDMKRLLDSLREVDDDDTLNQIRMFFIIYYIFNDNSIKANKMYNELTDERQKEFLNYLLDNVIKGKTAQKMKTYLNF